VPSYSPIDIRDSALQNVCRELNAKLADWYRQLDANRDVM
jgi:hypothetical protein